MNIFRVQVAVGAEKNWDPQSPHGWTQEGDVGSDHGSMLRMTCSWDRVGRL